MTVGKQMKFAEYEERIAGLPSCCLRWIMRDCTEALAAMPDTPNAGYYQDEILLCGAELSRRAKKHRPVNRENEFSNTLSVVWTMLKDAGYAEKDLIAGLEECIRDAGITKERRMANIKLVGTE